MQITHTHAQSHVYALTQCRVLNGYTTPSTSQIMSTLLCLYVCVCVGVCVCVLRAPYFPFKCVVFGIYSFCAACGYYTNRIISRKASVLPFRFIRMYPLQKVTYHIWLYLFSTIEWSIAAIYAAIQLYSISKDEIIVPFWMNMYISNCWHQKVTKMYGCT